MKFGLIAFYSMFYSLERHHREYVFAKEATLYFIFLREKKESPKYLCTQSFRGSGSGKNTARLKLYARHKQLQ